MQTNYADIEDFLNIDLNIDDEMEQEVTKKSKKQQAKVFTDDKLREAKSKMLEKHEIGTVVDALSRNARVTLENYLKRTPQYKVLLQQLEILKNEFDSYKLAGNKELMEKTKQMISDLNQKSKKFVKLYRKDIVKENNEAKEKIENSEFIKQLNNEKKELNNELKDLNPLSLIYKIRQYRELLGITRKDLNQINILDDDIVDIDDELSKESTEIEYNYNTLCAHIADMIDVLPSEVSKMNSNEILTALKNVEDTSRIEQIKSRLEQINIQVSTEVAKAKGYEDITNLIFDIFDFETVQEQQPKEMLAAANVELVKSIAYKQCSKLNLLHLMPDAVSYGLLALTEIINDWYKLQKAADSAISFSGFAYTPIGFTIQKGLYELTATGGMINSSSLATIEHKRNLKLKTFLKENPELRDLPNSLIEPLIEGLEVVPKTMTETEYSDMVTGGDEDGSYDVFANSAISSTDTETLNSIKTEFEELTKSIKGIFSLFKTKKVEGEIVETTQKIFNKFDFKLFKLVFGIEYKTEYDNNGAKLTRLYNQVEIAEILSNMYYESGVDKKFSQPAISARIETLKKDIKKVIEENPELKPGFEYIWNYIQGQFDILGEVDKALSNIDVNSTNMEFTIPQQISLETEDFEDEEFAFEDEFEDENY